LNYVDEYCNILSRFVQNILNQKNNQSQSDIKKFLFKGEKMPEKKDNKKKKVEKKTEKKKTEEKSTEETKEILPPLDFSSIILPFYTQALIKLGLAEDPISDTKSENLELVKRLIDLLDLLNKRTEGNLEPEEEKLLVACIHQLKIAYMEKAKIINL